jgi:Uma2 family endonuclease
MPSPTTNHQNIVGEIFYQIKSFLKANPIGQVFTAPYDVVLSDEDTVIPDIVFVNSTNEKIITSKNIEGTPDLIIEVVSSNRKRDFISKRNLYEKFGIKEYLIVDLVDKMYYKYLLSIDNIYKAPLEYNIADHISLATVPSFVLSLN